MIDDDSKTLWCGNLSEQVTEETLYELFLQAGPLTKVRIPKDRDGRQKNFAFITYCHEVSVPYAITLFRGTALYHRTLLLQSRGCTALLPPPIRCTGPEPVLDLQTQAIQQFTTMTETLREQELQFINTPRSMSNAELVLASLQGNWAHRHHPYRPENKQQGRDDHRRRDNHGDSNKNNNSKRSNSWRDKRNHRSSYNHRRH